MRGLPFLCLFVLGSACGEADDTTKGSDSAAMTEGSSSGSGTEGMTSTTPTEAGSGGVPECGGDYLCSGATAEACDADPCCHAIEGNIYQESDDRWCLSPDPAYIGCGHIINDTCDYTGALKCMTTEGLEIVAEIEDSCFPHDCMIDANPPVSTGACGA